MISAETFLLASITPLVVAGWLCGKFRHPASRFYLADAPNARSMHRQAVSRSGGLAIIAALLLTWSTLLRDLPLPTPLLIGAVAAIGVLGWWDDRGHIPAPWRLLVQLLVAGLTLVALGLEQIQFGPWWLLQDSRWVFVLALFSVVWSINLSNFADGIDGHVAGVGVIGFLGYAALAWQAGDAAFALLCLTVASATAGLWWWNRPPARLFMGDAGASVLGLLMALLALIAEQRGLAPAWLIVPVFGVLILDTGLTLLQRIRAGQRPWQAHRQHVYQRARLAGFSAWVVLSVAYSLTAMGVSWALLWQAGHRLPAAVLGLGLLVLYGLALNRVHRQLPFASGIAEDDKWGR